MDIYWKSASFGVFGNASNWNPAVVPGPLDIAKITVSGATIGANAATTVLGISVGADVLFDVTSSFTATEGTATGANRGAIDIEDTASLILGGTVDNIGTVNM